MSNLQKLIEMGFSEDKATYAMKVTNNEGVEPAMEWLLAHADETSQGMFITTIERGETEGETDGETDGETEGETEETSESSEEDSVEERMKELCAKIDSIERERARIRTKRYLIEARTILDEIDSKSIAEQRKCERAEEKTASERARIQVKVDKDGCLDQRNNETAQNNEVLPPKITSLSDEEKMDVVN